MSKRIVSSPAKRLKIYNTRSRARSLSHKVAATNRDLSVDSFQSPASCNDSSPIMSRNNENRHPESEPADISRREFLRLFEKVIEKLDRPEPPQPSRLTVFLQAFPKAWVPLKLNSPSMILYARLRFILELANYSTSRASKFVLAVLDESD